MTLFNKLGYMQQYLALCEEICVDQGEVLAKSFRTERIALQKAALDEAERAGNVRARNRVGTWCPLNLFARLHHGSLQICWQLVHRDRNTRSIGYRHLSKKKQGGYDMRSLLAHAHDFERELVEEYEEDAQCQRERWMHLMKVKHHLLRLDKVTTADTALVLRWRFGTRYGTNQSS